MEQAAPCPEAESMGCQVQVIVYAAQSGLPETKPIDVC
jgi:hypothetical protein